MKTIVLRLGWLLILAGSLGAAETGSRAAPTSWAALSLSPELYSAYADPDDDLRARFLDEQIQPDSVNSESFAAYGFNTGYLTGLFTNYFDIRFQPDRPFLPGELVQVSLTTGIQNTVAEPLPEPVVWSFRARTRLSGAYFTDSGQVLNYSELNRDVELGDWDGDGDLDVFASVYNGSMLGINDGGNFNDSGYRPGLIAQGRDSAVGDLDRDGDLDVLLLAGYEASGLGLSPQIIWTVDGAPASTIAYLFDSAINAFGAALGDLDGDIDLDIFLVGSEGIEVWRNTGVGAPQPFEMTWSAAHSHGVKVALGDFDEDYDLDALVANEDSNPDKVWLNQGDGLFAGGMELGEATSADVVLGDMDNDQSLDAAILEDGEGVRLWFGSGTGGFVEERFFIADSATAVDIGDLNGDSYSDLFVVTEAGCQVWLNDFFQEFESRFVNCPPLGRSVALGDLDNDGDLDAYLGMDNLEDGDRVWWNGSQPAPAPPVWQDQFVDTNGYTGYDPGLAVAQDDQLHIVYGSATGGHVSVRGAFWDGVTWNIETIYEEPAAFADAFNFIELSNLVLENGVEHLVFVLKETADSDGQVVYARHPFATANPWTFLSFDSYGRQPVLAVAQSGVAHLAYLHTDQAAPGILYRNSATYWQEEPVSHPDMQLETLHDIAIDAAGKAVILAGGAGFPFSSELFLVTRQAALDWSAAPTGLESAQARLAYASTGAPIIVFDDDNNTGLSYARQTSGVWSQQTIMFGINSALVSRFDFLLDGADQPHLCIAEFNSTPRLFYATRQASLFQVQQLTDFDAGAVDCALSLDQAGKVRIAYQMGAATVLKMISEGSEWTSRPVEASPGGELTALQVFHQGLINRRLPYLSYHSPGSGLRYARWDVFNHTWAFDTQLPLPQAGALAHASVLADFPGFGGKTLASSYYDPAPGDLFLLAPGAHSSTLVDSTGDVGLGNQLFYRSRLDHQIVYWDLSQGRLNLAQPVWNEYERYTNLSGPAVPGSGGCLSAIQFYKNTETAYNYVTMLAYLDAVGNVRIARWSNTAWSDEYVAVGNGSQTPCPVLAYDESAAGVRLAFQANAGALVVAQLTDGNWQHQVWVPAAGAVEEIVLLATNGQAELFYTQSGVPAIQFAKAPLAAVESIPINGELPHGLAGNIHDRERLSYITTSGVYYLFRSGTLGFPHYNPLQPCVAPEPDPESLRQAQVGSMVYPVKAGALLDDLEILRALRTLFAATPGGQAYIELYYAHSAETGAIALKNPGLLWDSFITLRKLLPGALSLVSGQGDRMQINQEMVDLALSIATRIWAAGSPELKASIEAQLHQYHYFQDFVGLSFDEAAQLLGVDPPAKAVFLAWVGK